MENTRLMQQVRCSLFFQIHSDRPFCISDLVRELKVSSEHAERVVQELCSKSIIVRLNYGDQMAYRYSDPHTLIYDKGKDITYFESKREAGAR